MIKPLAKSVNPLGLTAATSTADAGIYKKKSGHCPLSSALLNHPSSTTLIISNGEMEDIIKI